MARSTKQQLWEQHFRRWQTSGMSQVAYCQRHQLSVASFGYWCKRCRGSATMLPAVIPVERAASVAGVQLRLPGGWQIALPSELAVTELKHLLAALP